MTVSDGFVGFTFFGFCLGTQYTVFIDLPFKSPCIAFALFKPIFISLSGVSFHLVDQPIVEM